MITVEMLRRSRIFFDLDDNELERIIPFCREESYAKGSLICTEGDEATTLYILDDGEVRLHYEICPQPNACQNATILVDKPGYVACWSALVTPRRLTASAHSVSEVKVIAIDGKALNELMEQDSHIGFVVMKGLAEVIGQRLREAKELELDRTMGAL